MNLRKCSKISKTPLNRAQPFYLAGTFLLLLIFGEALGISLRAFATLASQVTETPQKESSNTDSTTDAAENRPNCLASLPITPLVVGTLAAQWECQGSVLWSVRAGVLFVSKNSLVPFFRGELGLKLPMSEPRQQAIWVIHPVIRYHFWPEINSQDVLSLPTTRSLNSREIQTWLALIDSDVRLEFLRQQSFFSEIFSHWGIRIWQTLPSQWRTLGSLRTTRSADMSGVSLVAQRDKGKLRGTLGIGRMTINIDRISASFFHPSVELSYYIGDTN
ncbi:hypothetical protein EBU99_11115 [bacterium]|nr:hypothetical protein [bacterium]